MLAHLSGLGQLLGNHRRVKVAEGSTQPAYRYLAVQIVSLGFGVRRAPQKHCLSPG